MNNWHDHISINPKVCHGRACIRGTRIPVSVVLDNIAAGLGKTEIIQSYPALTPDNIQTVLAYASFVKTETGISHETAD